MTHLLLFVCVYRKLLKLFFQNIPQVMTALMESNFLSVMYTLHAALPFLRKSKGVVTAILGQEGNSKIFVYFVKYGCLRSKVNVIE